MSSRLLLLLLAIVLQPIGEDVGEDVVVDVDVVECGTIGELELGFGRAGCVATSVDVEGIPCPDDFPATSPKVGNRPEAIPRFSVS